MSDSNNNSAFTKPAVNVDGTPMCGDVDIKGNPYGVVEVETTTDSCTGISHDSDIGFSSDDSFSSSSDFSSDDSFSSFDSGFMDDF